MISNPATLNTLDPERILLTRAVTTEDPAR
jgi:hypothetical protein